MMKTCGAELKQPRARRDTAGSELAEVNDPAVAASSAVRGAHKVLTLCLPGTSLPTDLSRLRAMLDAHMFGRDSREMRDAAVRVAWQIDSMRRSRAG